MPRDCHYDVIIVGTGAGGATLAAALAPSGKRILILERGGFIPRERENWDPDAVFRDRRYQAAEVWHDAEGRAFAPYTHYCVGGNTKVYGAALLRLRESDFSEVRHYGGTSPAWPISYADLEPYYTRAEQMYHVHGERGLDPCDPPASGAFPHPPLDPEPRIRELYEDIRGLGYRAFPIPLGVRIDAAAPAQAPVRLSTFDGYPDPAEVKSDSHVVALKPILGRPNVTLLTDALVERLTTDRTGRAVAGVTVSRRGEQMSFSADLVVLACGAINSAAVLLRSADGRHPRGLANSSGLVGRHYMSHHNGLFVAVTQTPNFSQFQKHFGLTDFYHRADDSDLPLGTVQLMGKPDRGTLEWLRSEPAYGTGEPALAGVPIEDIVSRTIDFFLTAEDLPDPRNRVALRDDGSIALHYRPNNLAAYERLQAKLAAILTQVERQRGRSDPVFLAARLGISGVSHQNGTLRFGHDPASSVLNVNCRAHDLDNLYVVDASFFPSSGAVNPSLTIMANALRVGEHLLDRLGASVETLETLARTA